MSDMMANLKPFQDDEHQHFTWPGGEPAALLIHGFLGTPADMRPLGRALHQAGWTVHGPLLPGFGPQVGTLFERRASEWVTAGQAALAELQQQHRPVLLVGHSMGAALSIQVAAARPPDAVVLLSPFWKLGEWWQRWIALALKPILRQVRPFKKVDFSVPEVRRGIANFMPGIDLDDPTVQQAIRELAVPVTILEQLYAVGKTAYRLAPRVTLPTLVVQGTEDETVPARQTRRLLQRLPGPLQYQEVVTGHNLIRAEDPGWPQVERMVLVFASGIC
jgi:carboxylesterase